MKNSELEKILSSYRLKLILVLVGLVYSIVVMAIPFSKGMVFWGSFLFTLVAIALQYPVAAYITRSGLSAKSRFYGFPLIQVAGLYLLVQFLFGVLCMALATFFPAPLWLVVVPDVVFLAAALVGLITADTVRLEVERQETEKKDQQQKVTDWRMRSKVLAERYNDTAMGKTLQQLAELFRFSDPVSSPALEQEEAHVERALSILENAMTEQKEELAQEACKTTIDALRIRNEKCKHFKQTSA